MCTGLMLKAQDGSIVHGRTLEFVVDIETSLAFIPRNYTFASEVDKGLDYTSKYAMIGGSLTFKNVKILDGLNEKGLSAGVFWFPTFCEYTTLTDENRFKALSPVDFINWILSQFETIDQVKQAIQNNNIIIASMPALGLGDTPPPMHYIVYDKTGKSIVIEPLKGKLIVYDNHLGVITNAPTFDWHMINLRNYISMSALGVQEITVDNIKIKEISQGNGMFGLPGDFTSTSRLVRAAIFSVTAVPPKTSEDGVLQIFHILNNFDIPLGAARAKMNGVEICDYTILTSVRDPQTLCYYYKTWDDQTIRMVNLNHFINNKEIKLLNIKGSQHIIDMYDQFQSLR